MIQLLRAALRAGQLRTDMKVEEMERLLALQENRWWSVNIKSFASQQHFLEYAGRYVRRPPIAQRRITYIGLKDSARLAIEAIETRERGNASR